jgi:glycosyltransferase involved in cell wall biosynthesis
VNHVALVIPGIDRMGGAERQVVLLARGLRLRGWRVSLVMLSGTGGPMAAELTATGIACLSLGMRKGLADPRGWIRFHRWLSQEHPDVVHAHLPHAAWLTRWSRLAAPALVCPAQVYPAPVWVDTLHSSSTGTWGRRLGYRFSRWLPDRVTAVSQAVAEAHLSAKVVRRDTLTVLPNGVDVENWQPDAGIRATARRELGLTDEFLWLAAGRLEPVKDYSTLLHAMVSVPEPARLMIAGSGPLMIALQQLSASLGLERRVRFLGFVPDVRRTMQAADAFVLSSLWEGLPMALLEAGACALPVVATDVPGSQEAVVSGQTGWLTPAGDTASLAAVMTSVMQTSPEKRSAMGKCARQRILDQFSMKTVLTRWEQFYAALLRENSRGIASTLPAI